MRFSVLLCCILFGILSICGSTYCDSITTIKDEVALLVSLDETDGDFYPDVCALVMDSAHAFVIAYPEDDGGDYNAVFEAFSCSTGNSLGTVYDIEDDIETDVRIEGYGIGVAANNEKISCVFPLYDTSDSNYYTYGEQFYHDGTQDTTMDVIEMCDLAGSSPDGNFRATMLYDNHPDFFGSANVWDDFVGTADYDAIAVGYQWEDDDVGGYASIDNDETNSSEDSLRCYGTALASYPLNVVVQWILFTWVRYDVTDG
jgi:hypothetical protein